MKDEPEGQVPEQQSRRPDSIWERYLTGKLSLEDKETLPALIKELHEEIARHLRQRPDLARTRDVEFIDTNPPAPPPLTLRKPKPIADLSARREHLARRRRIDPRQN